MLSGACLAVQQLGHHASTAGDRQVQTVVWELRSGMPPGVVGEKNGVLFSIPNQ